MLVWVVLDHYYLVTGLAAVTAVVVVFILFVTVRDFMVGAVVELQVLVGLIGVVSDIFVLFFGSSFLVASWLPSSGLVFSEEVDGFPLIGGVPGTSLT